MGLILTLALAFSAKRLETLSFLTPNQAGLSSSIIVAVGSVVFVLVSCDSDCGLFFPLAIGAIISGGVGGVAGSSVGVMYLHLREKG